jgi:hypothetical protein
MRPLLSMRAAAAGLSCSLLLNFPALAQQTRPTFDYVTAYRITGQILVDSFRSPAGAENVMDRTDQQWDEFHRAHSYVRGVQDALPVKWCIPATHKRSEFQYEVFHYLAKQSPAELQRDAPPLIGEAIAALYPCSKRKER